MSATKTNKPNPEQVKQWRKIALSLSEDAYSLLNLVHGEARGASRHIPKGLTYANLGYKKVDFTIREKYTLYDGTHLKDWYFSDETLKELLKLKLVTAEKLAEGVGLLECTELGHKVWYQVW